MRDTRRLPLLPARLAAQAFLQRWLRRGIIAGFGAGFTVPYMQVLNEVQVEGDDLLERLPLRNVVFLSNHQTYFMEALAFFDLVYVRHLFPLERPMLRFSAAEETMKKNVLTALMHLAGGVTLKRSFREGGHDVKRDVDLEGVSRVLEAIRDGWLLHYPAGTTRQGAPLRAGVARLLHDSRAVAVPLRADGFRELLLHQQLPGKLFRACRLRLHEPLDLEEFYEAPYTRESGEAVLRQLEERIGDRI